MKFLILSELGAVRRGFALSLLVSLLCAGLMSGCAECPKVDCNQCPKVNCSECPESEAPVFSESMRGYLSDFESEDSCHQAFPDVNAFEYEAEGGASCPTCTFAFVPEAECAYASNDYEYPCGCSCSLEYIRFSGAAVDGPVQVRVIPPAGSGLSSGSFNFSVEDQTIIIPDEHQEDFRFQPGTVIGFGGFNFESTTVHYGGLCIVINVGGGDG